MKKRRSKIAFLKMPSIIHFINASLIYVAILLVFNLYSSWKIAVDLRDCLQTTSSWWLNSVISQLSFTAAILVLLVTMFVLLHRSLGPIPRMERVLDKIIEGDHSLRLTVRKKDSVYSFVAKLNKVLDLLEKKGKS